MQAFRSTWLLPPCCVIKTFCTKDDKDIRNYILNISNKLDLLSDKEGYLKDYLVNYFDDAKIDKDISLYTKLIDGKIALIKDNLNAISYLDSEYSYKLEEAIEILFNYQGYNDLVTRLNIKLPIVPRGSSEELKTLKSEISEIIKEIKELAIYQNEEEIRESIKSTYNTVKVIIDLILEFTNRVKHFKDINNSYEFNDIAIMAINILKNNADVRAELRNYFKEIMIDE